MKKFTFTGLLTALMLFAGTTFGQEVIISDGFEDYSDGAALVEAARALGRDYWEVWGDSPGSAPDATVTTSQAFEGTKSVRIDPEDDVILNMGDQTAGEFRISFQAYVPTGKSAYFNILHKYAVSGSEWAVEIYLNTNGSTTSKIAGQSLTAATYPKDTWFPVVFDIDLNADLAIFTLNGVEVYEWQFSKKTDGSAGLRQLAAMDFYGAPTDANQAATVNEMFMDQVVFEEVTAPVPPTVVINVTEIMQEIAPGDTGSAQVTISNEGTGGAADVASYFVYTPQVDGTETNVTLQKFLGAQVGSGIGHENTYEREIAFVLTPADYKIGAKIEKIDYYLDATVNTEYGKVNLPISDLTFTVYGQGLAENIPGGVLATKVYPMSSFQNDDWNTVTLDDPIILTGGEYWVAVAFTQDGGTFPMTVDAGPNVYGGDWLRSAGGAWNRLVASSEGSLSYNWALRATGKGILSDPWGSCNKTYHSGIFAGASSDLIVNFDSKNLENGDYEATLVFLTNDPENAKIEIPVTMKISDEVLNTDSSIKGIFVDGVAATLADGSETEYWIEIDYTEKIEITIETTHPKATASGDLGEQNVVEGANEFFFKVVAEDPAYETNYMMEVTVKEKKGIDDVEKVLISIHPNPVQDKLYFDTEKQIQNVQIFDLNGRMIQEVKVSGDAIDVKELASGVYLVKIFTAEGNVTHKIIKK